MDLGVQLEIEMTLDSGSAGDSCRGTKLPSYRIRIANSCAAPAPLQLNSGALELSCERGFVWQYRLIFSRENLVR